MMECMMKIARRESFTIVVLISILEYYQSPKAVNLNVNLQFIPEIIARIVFNFSRLKHVFVHCFFRKIEMNVLELYDMHHLK